MSAAPVKTQKFKKFQLFYQFLPLNDIRAFDDQVKTILYRPANVLDSSLG